MMEFIIQNYVIILIAIGGIGGLFTLGKKKTLALAEKILYQVRDEIGDNIAENADKYTEIVYARIPLKAKAFVTKKSINNVILEIAYLIDVDEERNLDK